MTRAAVAARSLDVQRAALAVLAGALALMAAACREDSPVSSENPPPRIALPPNALYRYTSWELDEFGRRLAGSERQRRWAVLSTDADVPPFTDVTLVEDSSGGRAATLAFRFTPEGDIYQYGYLADLVERFEGRTIAPQWDRVAAYSNGWSSSWTVGVVDSAAGESMQGSSSLEELFFTVTVDGVPTIVAGYPIVLSSRYLESVFWVSDDPPGLLRLREERFPALGGRPGVLSEAAFIILR